MIHSNAPAQARAKAPARRWARLARVPLAAALALFGCAGQRATLEPALEDPTAGPRSATDRAQREPQVSPTLEEAFLIPGVHGQPPSVRALSANGEWLLFTWREMELEDGERKLADSAGPYLIHTSQPGATDHRGVPLSDALRAALGLAEGAEGDPTEGRLAPTFFPTGGDLAVVAGKRLYFMHPKANTGSGPVWSAELVLDLEGPEPPEPEDSADGDDSGPAKPRLRSIQSLEFEDDGRRLVLGGNGARLAFDLEAASFPLALVDGLELTREFPTGARAQWSDDYRTAFGTRALAELDPLTGEVLEASKASEEDEAAEEAEAGEAQTPAPETESTAEPLEAFVWRRGAEGNAGGFLVLEGYESGARTSLSPRGRFLLRTETDQAEAPDQTLVPDFLTERVTTRKARRQWAEDTSYPRQVAMFELEQGARTALEFPEDEGTWSNPIGWAPNPNGGPERHAWVRISPDHSTMQLWVWSEQIEGAGDLRLLFEDRDPRWYGGPAAWVRWAPDGERLILGSEATPLSVTPGHLQLFAVEVGSGQVRQLTEVAGEVSSFRPHSNGNVILTASGADPRRRGIGLVPAAAVRGERPATRTYARDLEVPTGWNNSPVVSADGSTVVFSHQTVGMPAELWVTSTDAGEPRRLTHTVPPAYEAIDWIRPVPFAAEHRDGTRVHSHVYLPEGTSLERPDRKRPVVVFIHGAGYLQNVTDSMTEYAVNLMFHSRLARMGYVVVDVDYRGSKGYGGAFRTDVQYHLGKYELEDIHLILDALGERGVVATERAACYGGSYGGFLTLMALFTAPERWVGGAALRSVTDWRTYHPRYTQPRLGRPSTHAEAYERSSPIDLAEGLEDPLLILHGMVDSNVFAQDSIRLIEALIDMGKDFDAMLYPSQGHAFSDGMHWLDEYRRIERFLIRHLGRP